MARTLPDQLFVAQHSDQGAEMRVAYYLSLAVCLGAIFCSPGIGSAQQTVLKQEGYYAACLAVAPDGKTVAVGYSCGHIAIYDLASQQVKATLKHCDKGIEKMAFDPTSRLLVAACIDSKLHVFDLQVPKSHFALAGDGDALNSVAFDLVDPDFVYGGGVGGNLLKWTISKRKTATLVKAGGRIRAVVPSATSKLISLVAWDDPDNVEMLNAPGYFFRFPVGGGNLMKISVPSKGMVTSLTEIENDTIAVGTVDGKVIEVDTRKNGTKKVLLKGSDVTSLRADDSRRMLVVGRIDGDVVILDRASGESYSILAVRGSIVSDAAISGRLVVAAFVTESLDQGSLVFKNQPK